MCVGVRCCEVDVVMGWGACACGYRHCDCDVRGYRIAGCGRVCGTMWLRGARLWIMWIWEEAGSLDREPDLRFGLLIWPLVAFMQLRL
jgi:hypothetical protein